MYPIAEGAGTMPSTVAKEGQDSQGEGRWMAMVSQCTKA